MKPIRLFHPKVSEQAIKEVSDVLRSGWLGLGPKVEEFEKMFSEYISSGKKIYCVATNSATSALHLSMVVNKIGRKLGDEVITTPMTFVSTNHSILYVHARPVFADIDKKTLNININSIVERLRPDTKAIVVVHYAGNPVDVHLLQKVLFEIERKDIIIIEDAAHAAGSEYNDKTKIGSAGNDTCFSFHAVKNIGIGDGGMYCTAFKDNYELAKKLVWLGIDKNTYNRQKEGKYKWLYDIPEVGFKYHMNDISATLGICALKDLEHNNNHRRYIAGLYDEAFDILGIEHLERENEKTSCHLYVIKIKDRDKFIEYMGEKKITCGVHYYPNHLYSMYDYRELKVAEREWQRIVSLPIHSEMSYADVGYVVECVKEYIEVIL